VFDTCLVVAYLMPGKSIALKAIKIAAGAHWVVTSAKTASYAVTSILCRTGYDFGNMSGANNDLWSWTCSDKADAMADVNQAQSNCMIQVRSGSMSPLTPATVVVS